jgi:hypothetical protein
MGMSQSNLTDNKEKRKAQLRESQRRRREKLGAGNKHQINIFLSVRAIASLDKLCAEQNLERHEVVEQLLTGSSTEV